MLPTVSDRLLSTGEAAKVIGVARRTLAAWMQNGLVEPALKTAGGHARWDVTELRRQLSKISTERDGGQ